MAGTKEGGKKASEKNLQRDPDYYKKIGAKGGKNGHTGGFAYLAVHDPEAHKEASAKGGRKKVAS